MQPNEEKIAYNERLVGRLYKTNPHHNFAQRVENIVCEMYRIEVKHLWTKRRCHAFAHPRFIIFAILWQPNGFRSLTWLAHRYKLGSHRSVRQGIERVEKSHHLRAKKETALEILAVKLEIELFGSRSPCYDTTPEPH